MAGDLLLEWYSFGSSGRTAEYRRLWFLSDGSFRINIIDWNDVSGESCTNLGRRARGPSRRATRTRPAEVSCWSRSG